MEETKVLSNYSPKEKPIKIRIHSSASLELIGDVVVMDTADVDDLRTAIRKAFYAKSFTSGSMILRSGTNTSKPLYTEQKLWQALLFDATTQEPMPVFLQIVPYTGGMLVPTCQSVNIVSPFLFMALFYLSWVSKEGEQIPPGFEVAIPWLWIFLTGGILIWIIFEASGLCYCCSFEPVRYSLLTSRFWGLLCCFGCPDTRRLLDRKKRAMEMRRMFQLLVIGVAILVSALAGVRSYTLAAYYVGAATLELLILWIECGSLQAQWVDNPERWHLLDGREDV